MFRKAFSLVELVFVIVVIGILSAIAIPKLAATRDDAIITKARNTIASVRNAVATERQKRILRGDFTPIASLHSGTTYVFNAFDGNVSNSVLEYPPQACASATQTGCWSVSGNVYTFRMPAGGANVGFVLQNNRFVCQNPADANCQLLTQ